MLPEEKGKAGRGQSWENHGAVFPLRPARPFEDTCSRAKGNVDRASRSLVSIINALVTL